ncbi:hypothetical protein AnaeK_3154 [Anaeromyxobacter sp. K]|uniref:hypothetical protein n=1 Tax=Anaeromyxobacter sp. (strain K) TaxID=447217 RepID=UPI00015F8491|nr:hypothetical protein [Anaeromyxobacter sp. K]ACG74375.1 hypothetical protein AnaeK_3154 [Anaeromyxobacter sp. K]
MSDDGLGLGLLDPAAPRPRVLWVSFHRTARYEEVTALLRCGAEVIPTSGTSAEFPNALEPSEDRDPLAPPWRASCSVPADVLELIRPFAQYQRPEQLPQAVIEALNRWIDVIWVGTYSRSVVELLRRFRGGVVLRAYGGYPYSASLGRWPARTRALDLLATTERYAFCPALPYQATVEDVRLTRNETFLPACVTPARLPHRWAGRDSEAMACEVISLIGRYRRQEYARFTASFGDLPVRILGQNPPGGEDGRDPRIVGTLDDEPFYGAIARSRLMIYAGLGSRHHLHYHPLEAVTMGVPVVLFRSSALAQMALHLGASDQALRLAGMCDSTEEARALAQRMLAHVEEALAISHRQDIFRRIFGPARWDRVLGALLLRLAAPGAVRRSLPEERHEERPFGSPIDGSAARSVARSVARGVGRRLRRMRSPR